MMFFPQTSAIFVPSMKKTYEKDTSFPAVMHP